MMKIPCKGPVIVLTCGILVYANGNADPAPVSTDTAETAGNESEYPSVLLAQDSADDLFLPDDEQPEFEDSDSGAPAAEAASDSVSPEDAAPESAEALFGDESPAEPFEGSAPEGRESSVKASGLIQNELAYTYSDPEHYSKFRTLAKLRLSGALNPRVKWQLSGTFFYNPVFEFEDFYPDRVEDDQKLDGWIDESFVDIDADNWEFRIGRQHIIWGETVGLFFADVISALDLREFVLPDFDLIRIPQWAARAEYFEGDFHAEIVYIPVVTKDNLGEVGGDYRPFPSNVPLGLNTVFLEDKMLNDPAEDFGVGARASYLANGWDLAMFYYTSPDKTAAQDRRISSDPVPTLTFKPVHERIHQIGATLAKEFGSFVLKSEAIETIDRLMSVNRISDLDGLVRTNELRYLVGVDWVGETGHNVNVQFFQTWFQDHDSDMAVKEVESGASVLLSTTSISPDITPEILWIRSLDRNDWLLETKVTWEFARNWRAVLGADIFEGRPNRLFGQFDNSDRVYYEMRYSF